MAKSEEKKEKAETAKTEMQMAERFFTLIRPGFLVRPQARCKIKFKGFISKHKEQGRKWGKTQHLPITRQNLRPSLIHQQSQRQSC